MGGSVRAGGHRGDLQGRHVRDDRAHERCGEDKMLGRTRDRPAGAPVHAAGPPRALPVLDLRPPSHGAVAHHVVALGGAKQRAGQQSAAGSG